MALRTARHIIIGLIASLILAPAAFGALPVTLADEGSSVRVASTGASVIGGNLTILIWDNETQGSLIYNETFIGAIENGSWNVILGSNSSNPLLLDYGRQYFKDYAINQEDVSFEGNGNSTTARQGFFSPLGEINGSMLAVGSISDREIGDSGNMTMSGTLLITNPLFTERGYVQDEDGIIELAGASAVFVAGEYAYAVSEDDNSFTVIDITDPANMTKVSALINGVDISTMNGPRALQVVGRYAYVVSGLDNSLVIIDVSDPSTPSPLGKISHGTGASALSEPGSIFVSGRYAYMTSEQDDSMTIIDISDPFYPSEAGVLVKGAGATLLDTAKSVFVSGGYAYVVSESDSGFSVINVTDPNSPQEIATLRSPFNAEHLGGASAVQVSGHFAYVTATNDGSIDVIDITDPAQPREAGWFSAGQDNGSMGAPSAIFVSGDYAYVGSASANSITILDISDPTQPREVTTVATGIGASAIDGVSSLYLSGRTLFATASTSETLSAFEISGVESPSTRTGALSADTIEVSQEMRIGNTLNVLRAISVGNDGIYTTGPLSIIRPQGQSDLAAAFFGRVGLGLDTPSEKLTISAGSISIQNASLRIAGNTSEDSAGLDGAKALAVRGNIAYVVANNDNTLTIFDISNPERPSRISSIGSSDGAHLNGASDVTISGSYALVSAAGDDGLSIIDISDPSHPQETGWIGPSTGTTLDGANHVAAAGPYAYVTSGVDSTLSIIDISNPRAAQRVSSITDGGGPTLLEGADSVAIADGFAYVSASADNGFLIINVSDPANPEIVSEMQGGTGMGAYIDQPADVQVAAGYAYVVSQNAASMTIINVSDPVNPAAVRVIAGDLGASKMEGASAVFISLPYAYVAATQDDSIAVIDVSDPLNPIQTGTLAQGNASSTLNGVSDIFVAGKYAYAVASISSALSIIDISGIRSPATTTGSLHASNVDIADGARIAGGVDIGEWLSVGSGGIRSDGMLTVALRSPTADTNVSAVFHNRVGIGTNTPEYDLEVDGDIAYTGSLTQLSDRRIKNNITKIPDALARLSSINGVFYTRDGADIREAGVIAQEVQTTLPEAVRAIDTSSGLLGVNYNALIPLLIEAVKEERTQIEALREEIQDLRQTLCTRHPDEEACNN